MAMSEKEAAREALEQQLPSVDINCPMACSHLLLVRAWRASRLAKMTDRQRIISPPVRVRTSM
jgi:hypothetical protein